MGVFFWLVVKTGSRRRGTGVVCSGGGVSKLTAFSNVDIADIDEERINFAFVASAFDSM